VRPAPRSRADGSQRCALQRQDTAREGGEEEEEEDMRRRGEGGRFGGPEARTPKRMACGHLGAVKEGSEGDLAPEAVTVGAATAPAAAGIRQLLAQEPNSFGEGRPLGALKSASARADDHLDDPRESLS